MTYRLMAEIATDAVCKKLGRSAVCVTATTPLPGSAEDNLKELAKKIWDVPSTVQKSVIGRIGDRAGQIGMDGDY